MSLPIWMQCLDLLQDTAQDCAVNPTGCISFGGHHMTKELTTWLLGIIHEFSIKKKMAELSI